MRKLARIMGLAALGLSSALYVELRSVTGILLGWAPRLVAVATLPYVALIGGLAAWIGLRKRDSVALAGGALGGLLAAIALRRTSLPHDALEQAFGAEAIRAALAALPAERRAHVLPARWGWRWPSAPEPRWTHDLAFWTLPDSDRQLLCDLWQPPDGIAPSGLAYIYLHGSGWRYFDKDGGTRPYFRHLAAQGHVVMDVAYRLLPEGDLFAQVGDAKRAVVWLKAHAADYGVDPARIVIAGGSAGGHLALLAAYTPNHPRLDPPEVQGDTSVCGVVSWYGPTDLTALYHASHAAFGPQTWTRLDRSLIRLIERKAPFKVLDGLVHDLMGGSPEETPDLYALASPVTHVGPHCPPTLLLQGALDVGVRAEITRALDARLRAAGCRVAYVELPYADHAFDILSSELAPPAGQTALYDLDRFLALLAA